MSSTKKIYFNRNTNVIYDSFHHFISKIMFTQNGTLYDRGSHFVYGMKWQDGEPVVFRYRKKIDENKEQIVSIYGLVYRDPKGDNDKDDLGLYRHISLFYDYHEILKLKSKNIDVQNTEIKMVNSVMLENDIIKLKSFKIKAGDNITLKAIDSRQIAIQGDPNTDTKYKNGLGISLDTSTNKFSVKTSNGSVLGGLKIPSVYSSTGLLACPIINGTPYYKIADDLGAGNDYNTQGVYVDNSGWYRIASSRIKENNYGIFNISASFKYNNIVNSGNISFIANYKIHQVKNSNNELISHIGASLTELGHSMSFKTSPLSKRVIDAVRLIFPNNNDSNKQAFIEFHINSPQGVRCDVNIDASNINNWTINDETIKLTAVASTISNTYSEYKIDRLYEGEMGAYNMYQGNFLGDPFNSSYRVIDMHNIASQKKGGIIKLGINPSSSGENRYVKLDNNNVAYVNTSNQVQYTLPKASNTVLGGLKVYGDNFSDTNYVYNALSPDNAFAYCKMPEASNSVFGLVSLGGSKDSNITDNQLIESTNNVFYQIYLDKNNKMYTKLPKNTVDVATTSKDGLIKLGEKKNTNITTAGVSTTGDYYGVQFDSNGKACVQVPHEAQQSYTLPTADIYTLGGVGLNCAHVQEEITTSVMTDGNVFPIIIDTKGNAYATVQTTGEVSSASGYITIDNVDMETFHSIYNPNTIVNGTPITNYTKLIMNYRYNSIQLCYILMAVNRYIGIKPMEIDIYTTKWFSSNMGDMYAFHDFASGNNVYNTITNLSINGNGTGNGWSDFYNFSDSANNLHIHIVRMFKTDGTSYAVPTYSVVVDLI